MVGDVEIPTRRVGAAAESEPGEQPRRLHSPTAEAAEAKSAARRSPGVHSLCLERHGSAPSYGSWSETCRPSLRPNAVPESRAGPRQTWAPPAGRCGPEAGVSSLGVGITGSTGPALTAGGTPCKAGPSVPRVGCRARRERDCTPLQKTLYASYKL